MLYKKLIKGYPNYKIYSDGRIERVFSKSGKPVSKFIKGTLNPGGYLGVFLFKKGISKRFLVARLVALHFVDGKSSIRNTVNHKDGNKTNNTYTNLEWCTISYNTKHAYDTGLISVKSKLTLAQVKAIRTKTRPFKKFYTNLGISKSTFQRIRNGKMLSRFK